MSKSVGQTPKQKATVPKAVSKAGPSAKAGHADNRSLPYSAPGSSSSATSTGSPNTAYPKAPPEKPRSSVSYSGPPGPSRDAALRARPKATADIPDEPFRLSFGNVTLSSTPPPPLPSPPVPPFLSQSPLPPSVPPRKIGTAESDTVPSAKHSEALMKPASSAKKRAGSTKKRRTGNAPSTRPQPFSFSTDTRKGRRTRQNGLVVDEDGPDDARAKKAGAKVRPKWHSPGMSVAKSMSRSSLLHQSSTQDPTPHVAPGSGASSSTDHWVVQEEPPVPVPTAPLTNSAPTIAPVPTANATTPSFPRRQESRQGDQTSHRALARQKSAGHLSSDDPVSPTPVSPGAQSGGSSASTAPARRRYTRDNSKDTFGPENRTRQAPSGTKEPQETHYWSPFTNSTPSSHPISPPLSERGSRPVHQRSRINYSVRGDGLADDGQDEDIGPTGTPERTRSTSILRGRLGSHLARASQHSDSNFGDSDRHVSFQTAEEVRQFCVVDTAPNTTRVSRRVFGGDLQVVLGSGNSTATTANLRSQGFGGVPLGSGPSTAVDRKSNALTLIPSPPRPCIRDLQSGGVD